MSTDIGIRQKKRDSETFRAFLQNEGAGKKTFKGKAERRKKQ